MVELFSFIAIISFSVFFFMTFRILILRLDIQNEIKKEQKKMNINQDKFIFGYYSHYSSMIKKHKELVPHSPLREKINKSTVYLIASILLLIPSLYFSLV